MTLATGTHLGRYEIRAKIGAGGMGEVYLAQDTKLDRKVALKILPAEVAADRNRMSRFVQEAKAASALNHPNIVTIHEIDQVTSTNFIATEFIDGETLRRRMKNTPMKLGAVLDVAAQIAGALSAAHEAHIIHRDIKPENIMLRRDGIVKVLDFGLAKLTERLPPDSVDTEAPTSFKTDPGTVVGTVIYMSPEQARGLEVDARTDIFSLGVVLFEMVTGCLPFAGSTSSEVLASLLSDKEPQLLARYSREVPTELERIVSKALRKNTDERYQTVKDMLLDLKSLKQELEFERKLERSVPPDKFGVPPSGGQLTGTQSLPPEGGTPDLTHPTSSAEYIVSEIKRHKASVGVAFAVLLIALLVAGYFYYTRARSGPIKSIAVLPFANASNDPNAEYLSDGITESLINNLSQVPGVKVIARTSSFQYRGKEADLQEVARALGVEAVLTGRVLQRGDSLLIGVELVNASDKTQVWGEQYNRKLADLLTVQAEISREIFEQLRLKLTSEEQKRVTKPYTGTTEAYQLYLQGRYYLNFERLEETKKALNFFDQAIALDPNYALAHAGVADAYITLGQPYVGGLPPQEALREAKGAATRALEIDDTLVEAHLSLARVIELYDWNWIGAETEYKLSIKLNPNYATSHQWYSEYLQTVGRHNEAMAEIRRAEELDPVNNSIKANIGYVFYTARQYDRAIEQFQTHGGTQGLVWAYEEKGMYSEAIAELQKVMSRLGRNDLGVASLAYAYAVSGKKSEAQKLLDELKEQAKQRYVSPYLIANIYIGLGNKDQAFAWLERAYEDHDQWMIWLKVYPQMDSLRSDTRFADLLRRMGFPQ